MLTIVLPDTVHLLQEDIVKIKILFQDVVSCWFMLYDYVTVYGAKT